MSRSARIVSTLAATLLACSAGLALAQQTGQAASSPGAMGDKAGKPPVADEAAKSGVATKKPAKAGAQSGPASGPAGTASMPARGASGMSR